MNAFYYLLEANVYLLVFYAFYRIFLKDETFYTLNRFYLLGTATVSFILPAFKLSGLYAPQVQYAVYTSAEIQQPGFWTAFHTGLFIYLLISAFFLIRFALRVYRISLLIREGKLIEQDNFRLVEIKGSELSFSFMNYIFINPGLKKIDTIIRHEEVHIRQRHSLDILFFEFLHIICWFSPLITLMQSDIKAVHEYIADEETATAENSAADYALFLIHNSYGAAHQDPGSQMFSKTLLKKRLLMLNQKRSAESARIKYAFLFVLMPLMLCVSAMAFTKTYGLVDLMPAQYTTKRQPPPPKRKVDQVKFPKDAPVSKKQSANNTSHEKEPPPPAPPKPKVDRVKFPPPVIVPKKQAAGSKSGNDVPPPPPPKPPKPKVDRVKFPPPVVTPKRSASSSRKSLPYTVINVDVIPEKGESSSPKSMPYTVTNADVVERKASGTEIQSDGSTGNSQRKDPPPPPVPPAIK